MTIMKEEARLKLLEEEAAKAQASVKEADTKTKELASKLADKVVNKAK